MPQKTREARKAAYDAWYARNRERRAEYKKRLLDRRRERNWRFKIWETAHMKPEIKEAIERLRFVNSIDDLERPTFVFELNGKRQVETLHDPLPEW